MRKGLKTWRRKLLAAAAFTLAETMIVVSIVVILAGAGTLAASEMLKRSRLATYDREAETIYIAAQRQMSALEVSGAIADLAQPGKGEASTRETVDLSNGEPHTVAAVTYSVSSQDRDAHLVQAELLLGGGVLADELYQGCWYVSYDSEAAVVLDVFYAPAGEAEYFAENILNDADKRKALMEKENRLAGGGKVGYYGGTGMEGFSLTKLPDVSNLQPNRPYVWIEIQNNEELQAVIAVQLPKENNEVYFDGANPKDVSLTIQMRDAHSHDVKKEVTLNGALATNYDNIKMLFTYILPLDSLKAGHSFFDLFGQASSLEAGGWKTKDGAYPDFGLNPGDVLNLDVSAEIAGEEAIEPGGDFRLHAETSSLFAYPEDGRIPSKTYIEYGRHLQNLDAAISHVNLADIQAVQIADIDFGRDNSANPKEDWAQTYPDIAFGPITNKEIKSIDGGNYKIDNIVIDIANCVLPNDNTPDRQRKNGLFTEFQGEQIKNLTLNSPKLIGGRQAIYMGIISGSITAGTPSIVNCRIEKGEVTDGRGEANSSSTAGFVGYVTAAVSVKDCSLLDTHITGGYKLNYGGSATRDAVGGLIGQYSGGTKITNIDGFIIDKCVIDATEDAKSAGVMVGGIIGASNGYLNICGSKVKNTELTGGTKTGNVGGFIGSLATSTETTASNVPETKVTDCAAERVAITSELASAPLGGLVATMQATQKDLTVTGVEMKGVVIRNEAGAPSAPAAGFIGTMTYPVNGRRTNGAVLSKCGFYMRNEDIAAFAAAVTDKKFDPHAYVTSTVTQRPQDAKIELAYIQGGTSSGALLGAATATSNATPPITVSDSFAATVVKADTSGGLVGSSTGKITVTGSYADCYLTGNKIGGLAGACANNSTFTGCYSAGFVVIDDSQITTAADGTKSNSIVAAGIVPGSATVTNCASLFNFDDVTRFEEDSVSYTNGLISAYPDVPDAYTAATRYPFVSGGNVDGASWYTWGGTYVRANINGVDKFRNLEDLSERGAATHPYQMAAALTAIPEKLYAALPAGAAALEHHGDFLERPGIYARVYKKDGKYSLVFEYGKAKTDSEYGTVVVNSSGAPQEWYYSSFLWGTDPWSSFNDQGTTRDKKSYQLADFAISDTLPPFRPFTMNNWFYGCNGTLTAISHLDRVDSRNTTSMHWTFLGCSGVTELDVDEWDTSKVTNMGNTFYGCGALTELNVKDWDTSNVTTLSGTFYGCKALTDLDVSGWDTSKVKTLVSTFRGCSSLTKLDLNEWNTSKVESLSNTFQGCNALTELDVKDWDTSKVTTLADTFYGCNSLTDLDVSNWDTGGVTTLHETFLDCGSLTRLNLGDWSTGKVTSMNSTFYGCGALTELNVKEWDTSNVTTLYRTFYNCRKLAELDVSDWKTGKVGTLEKTFFYCESLPGLNLSGWDTSNVTTMLQTFYYCRGLTEVNVKGWDTSKVTTLEETFLHCENLSVLDVSGWDTGEVISLHSTFSSCSRLPKLDVKGWKTANVTNMAGTFARCSVLEKLEMGDWNTSKVTTMNSTFYGCLKLAVLDVSGWDTAEVTNMYGMFWDNLVLTELDLSSWNTAKVSNMHGMFGECYELKTIYASENFSTESVEEGEAGTELFKYCNVLVGGQGSRPGGWDKTYARIDGGADSPGYFTDKNAPTTHTVTFEPNGGTSVDSQTVNDGETAARPADPTKEGHTFAGWYADAGLTAEYDFSTAVTGDVTVYAKWEEETTPVTHEPSEETVAAALSTSDAMNTIDQIATNGVTGLPISIGGTNYYPVRESPGNRNAYSLFFYATNKQYNDDTWVFKVEYDGTDYQITYND